MTDELRELIANGVLFKHRLAATTGREHSCSCDPKIWREDARHRYHIAREIIDELGLTVEEVFVYATDLQGDAEPLTDDLAARVVGKWWRT